jgi:L-fuconolactonase
MIIEWNHHLFSADIERHPWHSEAVYVPDPDMRHTDPLAHYLARMDRVGIDRAVVVQPEPYGDDHSVVLAALAAQPERLRATALLYPRDPDAPAKLRDLVARERRIVAVRFHAHRGKEQYFDSFANTGVRALWEAAARLGILVELHIGGNYSKQARALITAYPETPVLIDHLCEPCFSQMHEVADVLALAELPNVIMKLSGVAHIASDGPLFLGVRGYVRLLANTFGPDRLAWGGETPAWVRAHLDDWSPADLAKVLGGTVQRVLRWT